MSRCDVRDDHSDVVTSTDDYLWLKLSLVTSDESEAGSRDGLTLTQLQTLLLEDFGLLAVSFLSHFVKQSAALYIQIWTSTHFLLVAFLFLNSLINC